MKWDTPAVENSCFTLLIYWPLLLFLSLSLSFSLARFFSEENHCYSDLIDAQRFSEKTLPMDTLDVQEQLADQRRGRYVRVSDVDRRQLIDAYKKNEDFIALAKKLNIKRSTGKTRRETNLLIVFYREQNDETIAACQRGSYSYETVHEERKNVRYTRAMLGEWCTRSNAFLISVYTRKKIEGDSIISTRNKLERERRHPPARVSGRLFGIRVCWGLEVNTFVFPMKRIPFAEASPLSLSPLHSLD